MTAEEGELFYKSPSDEPVVCGIYMIAEPDKRIEVIFNYLDVPCENGGLVAVSIYLVIGFFPLLRSCFQHNDVLSSVRDEKHFKF